MQNIGLQHSIVRYTRDLVANKVPNPHKRFVAEGTWAHRLLVERGTQIDVFLWCPELATNDEVRDLAIALESIADRSYQISAKTLERISERTRPDGLVSIARLPVWSLDDLALTEDALVCVADGMEIAGNLGTLVRTADAVSADAVILTNKRVRLSHPKVLRASQGALLSVPVVDEDESRVQEWLSAGGFDVWLTETAGSETYRDVEYRGRRTAFVLGAEKYGLSKGWRDGDFGRVRIPMQGMVDSLNVSIAGAILMFNARGEKGFTPNTGPSLS